MEEIAVFGAGCFWGVEATFRKVRGVVDTEVGYTGGHKENPSYMDVCSHSTGHAEAVKIKFDPDKISYEELLDIFWRCHTPTSFNSQGPDLGSQYRSVIFYQSEKQKNQAMASKEKIQNSGLYQDKIVTEIVPAAPFYPAEEYHQRYLQKQGRG